MANRNFDNSHCATPRQTHNPIAVAASSAVARLGVGDCCVRGMGLVIQLSWLSGRPTVDNCALSWPMAGAAIAAE